VQGVEEYIADGCQVEGGGAPEAVAADGHNPNQVGHESRIGVHSREEKMINIDMSDRNHCGRGIDVMTNRQ
jgi:hypothetical protein